MNIKLDEMLLQNFAGIEHLRIKPDGENLAVYGANGTGKTTIVNAWLWLLFGKNSAGRADFGVKPLTGNGEEMHNLETSVAAILDCDGEKIMLERKLTEKWVRERGAVEKTFKGNETEYFINGASIKKMQYQAQIENLVKENVFKLITDPFFFNEKMKWQDRRKMLVEAVGGISNDEVIASNPELQQLAGVTNVETLADSFRTDLKELDKKLQAIPVRIAEAQRSTNVYGDEQETIKALNEANAEMERLTVAATELKNGAEKIRLQALLNKKEMELQQIKDIDIEDTNDYLVYKGMQESISATEKNLHDVTLEYGEATRNIHIFNSSIQNLRKEMQVVQESRFDGDICPTCGQTLPAEQLEEKRKEFNLNRAKKLDELEADALLTANDLENAMKKQKEKDAEIKKLEAAIGDMKAQAVEMYESAKATVENAHDALQSQRDILSAEIAEIKAKINGFDESIAGEIEALKTQYLNAKQQKEQNELLLGTIKVAKRNNERIKELQAQQKEVAAKYAEKEKLLFLCEQFARTKAELLSKKVNGLFDVAQFKLFNQLVNGGMEETCEVVVNGVSYADLNNAMKINAGLDLINTISRLYGVTVPVFVDNAESVTDITSTTAQQIQLYVSGADEKLRFERI